MGFSHFTDITCPWGVGRGQNVGLRDFCHILTLLPPGASVFHKHMSIQLVPLVFFKFYARIQDEHLAQYLFLRN